MDNSLALRANDCHLSIKDIVNVNVKPIEKQARSQMDVLDVIPKTKTAKLSETLNGYKSQRKINVNINV